MLKLMGDTRLLTTRTKIDEVERSLPYIAHKRGLDLELLNKALLVLPVEQFSLSHYEDEMEEANERIGKRDPTDADLLALALTEEAPLWSQDKDFQNCGVELCTTELLLKSL